jgi:hypothetical protein
MTQDHRDEHGLEATPEISSAETEQGGDPGIVGSGAQGTGGHTDHGIPDDHGHGAHAAHDTHDDHGDGDGHGHGDPDAAAEASTLVPVTWRQLIFPALIVLLVAILLAGPVSAAFAPQQATPAGTEQQIGGNEEGTTEGGATGAPEAEHEATTVAPTATQQEVAPTATSQPVNTPTVPASTPTNAPAAIDPSVLATRTAVADLGAQGVVSRRPVQLEFAGAQFAVEMGTGLLPDWKPTADEGRATWIQGTYANHLIYLPYSDQNAVLFQNSKPGEVVKLTMDTGQVFEFAVTRAERAANGPPSADGQFTVTTAMNQDHAGVTLFLVGDPAIDRALVQADFTGNIQ